MSVGWRITGRAAALGAAVALSCCADDNAQREDDPADVVAPPDVEIDERHLRSTGVPPPARVESQPALITFRAPTAVQQVY